MSAIVRNLQDRPVLAPAALDALLQEVGDCLGQPVAEAGFAFVEDAVMEELHDRFSGDPATTDVLSFPAHEESDPHYLGDVVICTDQALRQARALRHPYTYELMVLALHGVLHLCGLDHTRDRGEMHRIEERLRPRCAVAARRS